MSTDRFRAVCEQHGDRFGPDVRDFFPAAIEGDRWSSALFAMSWFVDVGMLYWRTDLMATAPVTFDDLAASARRARTEGAPMGFVWSGARYEGEGVQRCRVQWCNDATAFRLDQRAKPAYTEPC